MSTVVRQYPYRTKWSILLLGVAFFGACTVVIAHEAQTCTGGVVINGLIHLSPFWGKVFLWALACLSFGFVAVALFMAYLRLTRDFRIAVTTDGLLLPKRGWTAGQESHVRFADIIAVKRFDYRNSSYLYIYANGLRYTVAGDLLPSKQDFAEILASLQERAGKESGPLPSEATGSDGPVPRP